MRKAKVDNELVRTDMGHYVLKNDTHLSRWVDHYGTLGINIKETRAWSKYIPRNGIVIDAGACIGDSTSLFAQMVGGLGTVWAYEPSHLMYRALVANMMVYNNVICMNNALGDKFGKINLNLRPNAGASYADSKGDEVTVKRLDDGVWPQIDFIHLDAEGYEPLILDGAAKTIRKHKPVMVLECCWEHLARYDETEQTLRKRLTKLGYRVEELSAIPFLPERNILCLPT